MSVGTSPPDLVITGPIGTWPRVVCCGGKGGPCPNEQREVDDED